MNLVKLCTYVFPHLASSHYTTQRFCSSTISNGSVRVRFAPSPTGQLHLGALRTALYNYLFAKKHGGDFLLRIEDTDQTRIVEGAVDKMIDILEWIGLKIDEGPSFGGNYGPYVQSERLSTYKKYIEVLLENNTAYRCFCSDITLNLMRRESLRRGETPKYDNRCRHLTKLEIDKKLNCHTPHVIRLKLQDYKKPWRDLIYGPITNNVASIEGDPILMKSDGFPTYHFANVVDDHLMAITHVLRGVEWQISTTKHLLLYEAFGWSPPQFGHLPVILNSDGTKLSKRQNAVHVEHFRREGYEPESILNLLTLAGSGFTVRHTEGLTLKDLVSSFDLEKINTASTQLDFTRLSDLNRTHLRRLISDEPSVELIEKVKDVLKLRTNVNERLQSTEYIKSVLVSCQNRISKVEDLFNKEFNFLWSSPNLKNIDILPVEKTKYLLETLLKVLHENSDVSHMNIDFRKMSKEQNVKFSSMMLFFRLCLSEMKEGPGVAEMMLILGRDRTIERLTNAFKYLKNKT